MIFKLKLLPISIIVIFAILAFLWLNERREQNENQEINCMADAVIHVNDNALKFIYSMQLLKKNGVATITGKLYDGNNKVLAIVNRQSIFSYTQNGSSYVLQPTNIQRFKTDTVHDQVLSLYFPMVFIKSDSRLNLDILPITTIGWVVNLNSSPFLFCNAT